MNTRFGSLFRPVVELVSDFEDNLTCLPAMPNAYGYREPLIEQDKEYYIQWNLERWHDRAFQHQDPWRYEPSQVEVWT